MMQSPTYLQLDVLLPIDVYYATLTFIGKQLADTTHTNVKVLPKPDEPLQIAKLPTRKALQKSTRVNLRKLVEENCECGECFELVKRDHTSPWYYQDRPKEGDDESDETLLWNVRDGDVIYRNQVCESLIDALGGQYEKTEDPFVGFITPNKQEIQLQLINDKKDSLSEMRSISERRVKVEQQKLTVAKDQAKVARDKFLKQEQSRKINNELTQTKLEEIRNKDSKFTAKVAKSLIKPSKPVVEEVKKYAAKELKKKIVWVANDPEGFKVTYMNHGKRDNILVQETPSGSLYIDDKERKKVTSRDNDDYDDYWHNDERDQDAW